MTLYNVNLLGLFEEVAWLWADPPDLKKKAN